MGAWVSPTSTVDADMAYTDDALVYDGSTTTYAHTLTYPNYLEIVLPYLVLCNKIRIHASRDTNTGDPNVDIDVYYGGAYTNIFSGTVTKSTWVEKTFDTQTITKARVKFNTFTLRGELYEFAFWDISSSIALTTKLYNRLVTTKLFDRDINVKLRVT